MADSRSASHGRNTPAELPLTRSSSERWSDMDSEEDDNPAVPALALQGQPEPLQHETKRRGKPRPGRQKRQEMRAAREASGSNSSQSFELLGEAAGQQSTAASSSSAPAQTLARSQSTRSVRIDDRTPESAAPADHGPSANEHSLTEESMAKFVKQFEEMKKMAESNATLAKIWYEAAVQPARQHGIARSRSVSQASRSQWSEAAGRLHTEADAVQALAGSATQASICFLVILGQSCLIWTASERRGRTSHAARPAVTNPEICPLSTCIAS
eukprot:TRINITY_DN38261_c0_g1_i6.p1 TRINITY_DN38261_c0_g1~~TRINITY_DN38261_c0_g1_i6.p1  ORF type:complete len:271 (-),score=29.72 TRINITY_DN38261_c0_g1_i6:52-864(-)